MIEIVRVRTVLIVVALCALMVLAACGDGDDGGGATPTAGPPGTGGVPPLDAALFPVVLESDARVVAQADGSGSTEEPVEPVTPRPSPADTFEYPSPNGTHWASFRDGTLYVREADEEPAQIAEIPSTAEFANMGWSPDGERLVVDASFEGQTDRLYVVNVDGSGLTNVAEGLPGDAYAKSWSPDGQLLSFGMYTGGAQPNGPPLDMLYVVAADGSGRKALGEFINPQGDGGWDVPQWSADGSRLAVLYAPGGGIRVFDTTGGPAVDIGGQDSTTKLSWSPDGLSLAFDGYDQSTMTSSIVIVDAATPDVERVLTEGYWPRWSPAGDRIAFKRGGSPSAPGEVFAIGPDGTGEVLIGDMGPEARLEITWSDDGTQVEFIRAASGDQRVYALDLRSGEATLGATSLSEAGLEPGYPPALSPDGERVAFPVFGSKEGGPSAGWYVMELDTGLVTKATDDARMVGDIFWTNGTIRLALSAGVSGVYVAEGDGSAPRLISSDEAYTIAWSPDGERLALAKDTELRVITAVGAEELAVPTGLSPGSGQVTSIAWSPDGTALLFETTISEGDSSLYGVFVSALDGSAPRAISTSSPNPGWARWSPDGETIAYSRKNGTSLDVVLADADGEGERVLTSIEAGDYSTVDLVWSPDGSMVAGVVGQNDTYVMDVETGTSVFVATNAGNCLMNLLGWSEDSQVLLLTPRCALGGI